MGSLQRTLTPWPGWRTKPQPRGARAATSDQTWPARAGGPPGGLHPLIASVRVIPGPASTTASGQETPGREQHPPAGPWPPWSCGPWTDSSCPGVKGSWDPEPSTPSRPLPPAAAAKRWGKTKEIGDLNNGRKLLCLRASWSPAPFPVRVITGTRHLMFLSSEPGPAVTMRALFPVSGIVTRGRHAWGSRDRTRGGGHLPERRGLQPGLEAGEEGDGRPQLTGCTCGLVTVLVAGTAAGGGVLGIIVGGRGFRFLAKP